MTEDLRMPADIMITTLPGDHLSTTFLMSGSTSIQFITINYLDDNIITITTSIKKIFSFSFFSLFVTTGRNQR